MRVINENWENLEEFFGETVPHRRYQNMNLLLKELSFNEVGSTMANDKLNLFRSEDLN